MRQWLSGAGVSHVVQSENKAWLAFHASVAQAESLLHTEYFEYEDRRTGGIMPSCERYHVPKHVREHIDYITPGIKLLAPSDKETTNYGGLRKRGWPSSPGGRPHHGPWPKHYKPTYPMPHNPAQNLSTCDIAITPACVKALYQISPGHLANPKNTMGIFEAELQFWDQEDLNLFFTNFTKYIPNGTHPTNNLIDGGVAITTNISEAGGESMLDL